LLIALQIKAVLMAHFLPTLDMIIHAYCRIDSMSPVTGHDAISIYRRANRDAWHLHESRL